MHQACRTSKNIWELYRTKVSAPWLYHHGTCPLVGTWAFGLLLEAKLGSRANRVCWWKGTRRDTIDGCVLRVITAVGQPHVLVSSTLPSHSAAVSSRPWERPEAGPRQQPWAAARRGAELRIGDGLIRIGDGDGILLTSYRTFTATRVVDCCVDAREPTHNGTGTGRSTDATGPDAHVASPNAAHAHYRVCENSLLSFVELSGFEKSAARVCVSSHSRRADVHSPQSVYPPHQCAASPRLSARLWRREPSCVDVRIPPRPLRALSAPHTRTCPRLVAWHTARKG